MWKALRSLVGLPAVAVLLVVSIAIVVMAAATGGPVATVFGGLFALVSLVLGFAILFGIYIRKMNEDIDSDRHELKRELDRNFEDVDSEE